MNEINDDIGRGTTRILVGLIFTLSSIAQIFSKTNYSLMEYMTFFVMFVGGIILIYFGYKSSQEK